MGTGDTVAVTTYSEKRPLFSGLSLEQAMRSFASPAKDAGGFQWSSLGVISESPDLPPLSLFSGSKHTPNPLSQFNNQASQAHH